MINEANVNFKAEREAYLNGRGILFTLDSIFGNERQMWDRTKKEYFFIKGERAWKNGRRNTKTNGVPISKGETPARVSAVGWQPSHRLSKPSNTQQRFITKEALEASFFVFMDNYTTKQKEGLECVSLNCWHIRWWRCRNLSIQTSLRLYT